MLYGTNKFSLNFRLLFIMRLFYLPRRCTYFSGYVLRLILPDSFIFLFSLALHFISPRIGFRRFISPCFVLASILLIFFFIYVPFLLPRAFAFSSLFVLIRWNFTVINFFVSLSFVFNYSPFPFRGNEPCTRTFANIYERFPTLGLALR